MKRRKNFFLKNQSDPSEPFYNHSECIVGWRAEKEGAGIEEQKACSGIRELGSCLFYSSKQQLLSVVFSRFLWP